MEQYKKYKEVLDSYGFKKNQERYELIAKQQRYILQRMPNMYLVAGMGAFVGLFAFGMIITLFALVFSKNTTGNPLTYQTFVNFQLIILALAAISWFIIGPIFVHKARRKNADCGIADDVKKMSFKDSLLLCFQLRQEYLNTKIRSEIANDVYCAVKDRAIINPKLNNCDFKPLNKKQEAVINDVDARLTVFINNKFAVMKMFEEYLSRDWGKTLIEGFLTSMVLAMFIWMPYFAPDVQMTNFFLVVGVSCACVLIPFICRWIGYFYPKKAYEEIVRTHDVELTLKTRLCDIEKEYEALLDCLTHEYVVKMAGFMEANAIDAKESQPGWLDADNSEDEEKSLYDQIYEHVPFDEQESQDKETILAFLDCFENALTRQNVFGHLCASAFVLSADGTKALMLHHKIMNDYIYPGGHADGISDLYSVALREVEEETGLVVEPVIGKKIFSVQAAPVKGHVKKGKFVSAHNHYDVLYLFRAKEEDMDKIRIAEDENFAVEWRPLDQTYNEDVAEWARPVIKRIVEKVKTLTT